MFYKIPMFLWLTTIVLMTATPLSLSGFTMHDHDHEHGVVNFPVSCNEHAQERFETGLAHLHHMMYEQARPEFEAAAEADPNCAMAYWGIAMSSFQPLWHPTTEEGMKRGKKTVKKAKELGTPTEREQKYIAAVDAFFTDPYPPQDSRTRDHLARIEQWKKAQRKVHEAYPDDVDAAAFYGLAEVCYAVAQFSPDEEHDYSRERMAGAMLEQYFEDHPEHPGLFHYIIHAYDSSELAHKALQYAREYDKLAPTTPHALHMPSHIFVRLGKWEETADWNERSAEAAWNQIDFDAHASAHYVHALDYMMYAYLQKGDREKARETLERVQNVDEVYPAPFAGYNLAAPQARYYLEQRKWGEAVQLEPGKPAALPWENYPEAMALFSYARGLGAARSGDLNLAQTEREKIGQYVESLFDAGNEYWGYMTKALGQAVEAWILYERGETEQALTLMREAAELEDSMDKHPTTPGEILPVRELYGDLLLREGRTDEALRAYEKALDRTPNRRNAERGMERATALR
jgi:tetratricopeptide (TPR) repeat protein